MVWYQEPLLPPYENGPSVTIRYGAIWFSNFLLDMPEGGETRPVHHILCFVGSPIPRQEPVATTDDLSVEVCGELRPVVRQTANAKVTTQER